MIPIHIVVVDDDPTILKMLATTLRATLGCEVSTFSGARAALAALPSFAHVDLVISDWTMPELSGPDLALELRKAGLSMPVVLLSAVGAETAPPPEVALLLRKPCPPRTLAKAVDHLISRASSTPLPFNVQESRIAALKTSYRARLKGLRARYAVLLEQQGDEVERELRDQLHQLAGTCGTYGYEALMKAALELRSAIVARRERTPEKEHLLRELDAASEGA